MRRVGVGLISVDLSNRGNSYVDTANITFAMLQPDEYIHYWKLSGVRASAEVVFTRPFVAQPHFCLPFINCYCNWKFESDGNVDIVVNNDPNYVGELIDQILIINAAMRLMPQVTFWALFLSFLTFGCVMT